LALATAISGGCGGAEGVAEGATVSVYSAAGACKGAKRALAGAGGRAGSLRVRARCLPEVRRGGRLDLATIGANARRASQDSTTVAYIGESDAAATRFSETILEEANIGQISSTPGAAAMRRVLGAIEEADGGSGSLREEVRDELQP
jgi:branched-chain amino acid transport system substrate-binding protein